MSPFENIRRIYCVAAHKLILNVSKIRLRLICARALYLYRLFAKGLRQKARLRVLFALQRRRRSHYFQKR